MPFPRDIFVVALLLIAAMALVYVRASTVHETYEYVKKRQEHTRLQTEIQKARADQLKLTSPIRLQKLAKQMDLSHPSRGQILRYDEKQ